jgi:hypothetical protein
MTIKTYSGFTYVTYGHTITDANKFLEFEESVSGVLTAELNVGSYSLGEFSVELARAMNAASLNEEYTTALDRTTRKITINGTNTFSLLVDSAMTAQQSVYSLAGFNGADRTGSSSYEADSPSGSFFEPQFLLQDYIPFENDQRANNVTLNETPSGSLEVIKFGDINFMTCNIKYQKNQEADEPRSKGNILKYSQTGYTDLLAFLRYAATKAAVEIVYDVDNPDTFTRCLLESTSKERNGTGFTIRELYAQGFADWYESGKLVFRKLTN